MSEQELVSEIEEVEVAVAEATEESAAIEQQAEEATEAVEGATGTWCTPTPVTRTR